MQPKCPVCDQDMGSSPDGHKHVIPKRPSPTAGPIMPMMPPKPKK